MTFQKIASMVAKMEGKKSQVKIGDIREILKILVTLEMECRGIGPISSLKNMAFKALIAKMKKERKKK